MYVETSYKTQEQTKGTNKSKTAIATSRKGAKDPQLSWLQWQEPRQNQTGDQEKKQKQYVKGTLKQDKTRNFQPRKIPVDA